MIQEILNLKIAMTVQLATNTHYVKITITLQLKGIHYAIFEM